MKLFATLLLVGAAVVFVVTRSLEDTLTWLGPVRATAEAAMVGALADWFAVTALFRHPLGIPIPHTAIIPHRREKIIESIVSMVQNEWLSPDVIGARLLKDGPHPVPVSHRISSEVEHHRHAGPKQVGGQRRDDTTNPGRGPDVLPRRPRA
jgi:uncharacterized membrane-anchored protein YjiN (DUF445 family)